MRDNSLPPRPVKAPGRALDGLRRKSRSLSFRLTALTMGMMLLLWGAMGTAMVLDTAREIQYNTNIYSQYYADTAARSSLLTSYRAYQAEGRLEEWYATQFRQMGDILYPNPPLSRRDTMTTVCIFGSSDNFVQEPPILTTHVMLRYQGDDQDRFGACLVLDGLEARDCLEIRDLVKGQTRSSFHPFPALQASGRQEGWLFYVDTLTIGDRTWSTGESLGTDTWSTGEETDQPYYFSPGQTSLPQLETALRIIRWCSGGEIPSDLLTQENLSLSVGHGLVLAVMDDSTGLLPLSVYIVSTPLATALRQHAGDLLWLLLAVLAAGLLFSSLIRRLVAAPLKVTAGDFAQVARLDFDHLSGNCRRKDEIGDLNRHLRTMAEELRSRWDSERALERRRQEFVAAASHELKTPLALLSGYTEAIAQEVGDRERHLDAMEREIRRMDGLVREMLDMTRLERMDHLERFSPVDLSALTAALLEQTAPLFRGLTLSPDLERQVCLPGDRELLERGVGNLLTNAARYCRPGGRVTVHLEAGPLLWVENEADPIPLEELPRLFELFYRGDKARDRSGSGMGLAIAGRIFALHHLACRCENVPGGVRFTVEPDPPRGE